MASMPKWASVRGGSAVSTDSDEFREQRRNASAQWYDENSTAIKQRVGEWRRRNPHKRSAHNKVAAALKSGRLIKPATCEGATGSKPISCSATKFEAHHDDYQHPLTVVWLCRSCHRNRHVWLNAAGKDPDQLWKEQQRQAVEDLEEASN